MSVSRPPAKQAKVMGQSMVTRTESVASLDHLAHEEGSSLPISTLPDSTDSTKKQRHPKGHKVRDLSEVWKSLDDESYLRLTDTLVLGDVWFLPIKVEPLTTLSCNVTFLELVDSVHMKVRKATHKMSVDDICKVLYLKDRVCWTLQGQDWLTFEDWLSENTANFIKANGVGESTNRAKLCDYLLNEDHISHFTFSVPSVENCLMFFRKTCVHSYKSENTEKVDNPAMIKCKASKSDFEYIFEFRLIPVPVEWRDLKAVSD